MYVSTHVENVYMCVSVCFPLCVLNMWLLICIGHAYVCKGTCTFHVCITMSILTCMYKETQNMYVCDFVLWVCIFECVCTFACACVCMCVCKRGYG
jgi:hypothetical protein